MEGNNEIVRKEVLKDINEQYYGNQVLSDFMHWCKMQQIAFYYTLMEQKVFCSIVVFCILQPLRILKPQNYFNVKGRKNGITPKNVHNLQDNKSK